MADGKEQGNGGPAAPEVRPAAPGERARPAPAAPPRPRGAPATAPRAAPRPKPAAPAPKAEPPAARDGRAGADPPAPEPLDSAPTFVDMAAPSDGPAASAAAAFAGKPTVKLAIAGAPAARPGDEDATPIREDLREPDRAAGRPAPRRTPPPSPPPARPPSAPPAPRPSIDAAHDADETTAERALSAATTIAPPAPARDDATPLDATPAPDPSLPPTMPPPPPPAAEITQVWTGPETKTGAAAGAPPASPVELRGPPSSDRSELTVVEGLKTRAARLADPDPIGSARALVELGLHAERVAGDLATARRHYAAARRLAPRLAPALSHLRRVEEARADLAAAIDVVAAEVAAATSDAERAELLSQRARLCAEVGRTAEGRAAYAEALALAPRHAASLAGLEAVLRRELAATPDGTLAAELAAHLERLAAAVAPPSGAAAEGAADPGDARLAAWIEVERAGVLDRQLGDEPRARAALERAAALDPGPGPVRDALRRHLVRHGRTAELAAALAAEAEVEPDAARASRLDYAAARILLDVERAPREAVPLLARAVSRAPEGTPTARRAVTELVRRLEDAGEHERAARLRERRLAELATPQARAHEHVQISAAWDALGRADQAAAHAAEALALSPDDGATRERLDRALSRLGRHEERLRTWLAAAGRANRPSSERVRALLRAADIAERQLARRDDALGSLRAAWVLDPGNQDVFDALSALLAPPPSPAASDARGVRARVDLYTQGAQAARDPARAIALFEKLAALWEDELGEPARALEVLDRVLALDPKRRTALVALERVAERAGDHARLARALTAEAELTPSAAERRRLLIRAADVTAERLGDRERAAELAERALDAEPGHPDALRALHRLHERAGRRHDALAALRALAEREPEDAFDVWLEIARLEERLKHPREAVTAYGEAARRSPGHPLPRAEIARLLRQTGDLETLAAALGGLAGETTDRVDRAMLRFEAAEVAELGGNPTAALAHLARADEDLPGDPAIPEATERIHLRREAKDELATLYDDWLDRQPSAVLDHGLRVALAEVLADGDEGGAAELLEELVAVVPGHVPALRSLAHLYRAAGASAELAGTLRRQSEVFASRVARAGALWELAALEGEVGQDAALDALERLAIEAPADTAVLDATIRIATERAWHGAKAHAPAAPERLFAAVCARRQATRDPLARATFLLEEALLCDGLCEADPSRAGAALAAYRAALAAWPESVLAAHGLARFARSAGDEPATIVAELALAKLYPEAEARARHLVTAAELTAGQSQGATGALALYIEALAADPDSTDAALALASLLAPTPGRLADVLGAALARARSAEVVGILGKALAEAALRHDAAPDAPDPAIGIAALRRALAVRPDDGRALLLFGRLLAIARLPTEAEQALVRAAASVGDTEQRVAAHLELARLYEGPLADPPRAKAALEAALALDPRRRAPLERLHAIASAQGDRALASSTLARLVEGEADPATRVDRALRLAELRREIGDMPGVVRALCDAIVTAPADARAGTALARLFRVETPGGAAGYASALSTLLEHAAARRVAPDPRWLGTLGMLEVRALGRPRDGLARLAQAAAMPGASADVRALLGRGLEAAGHSADAAKVLREVLGSADGLLELSDRAGALAALDAALARDARADERIAVDEVRACLGELGADRVARLRSLRAPPDAPPPGSLAGADLVRLLVPEAKTHIVDVAVAVAPVAARILLLDPATVGVGPRDRLGPRDASPLRLTVERLSRAFGVEALDVYAPPGWTAAARLFPGDPAVLVAPSSLSELSEAERTFALARLVARAALGFAWLDEVPLEVGDALLLATARAVDPGFAAGELAQARESALQSLLPHVQRALGRRSRKLVEDVAAHLAPPADPRAFALALRRSEVRLAYLACGDLLASLDALRRVDRDLARADADARFLLHHPVTGELVRYALSAEAAAERQRIGTARAG